MKKLIITLAIATIAFSSNLFAAKASIDAKVTRVLMDDERYGQCMAQLDVLIASSGLDCPSNYVTLSCSGDFSTKDIAYHKFENAQMSLALNKRIKVYIDDTKKHNGYCYAYRVVLVK